VKTKDFNVKFVQVLVVPFWEHFHSQI